MDVNDLENAINSSAPIEEKPVEPKKEQMTSEQEIWFHKGSINTLLSERNELVKMIKNVETIIQMHAKRLKELE